MMITDMKKNELNELKKDEQNEQELTETEMEEVAGGLVIPGPLDLLKQA